MTLLNHSLWPLRMISSPPQGAYTIYYDIVSMTIVTIYRLFLTIDYIL